MAQAKTERRGLGRGLSALMSDIDPMPARKNDAAARKVETFIPVDRITPNADQPRRAFTEDALKDLTASVRQRGIIQPLIVG